MTRAGDMKGELIRALSADINGGTAALDLLDAMSPEEAGSMLLDVIDTSDDERAVAQAATDVAKMGDPRAFETLATLLGRHSNLIVARALFALRELADPRAVDVVISHLRDRDARERPIAASILAGFQAPSSVQTLIECLHDTDLYVCLSAIRALGGFREPDLFDSLALLVEEEGPADRPRFQSQRIRSETWDTLAQFRGTEAEPKLRLLEEKERARIVAAFRARVRDPQWRYLFRRSSMAEDAFYATVKIDPDLVEFCKRLGVPHRSKTSMYSPGYEAWCFLDGGVAKIHPYGMGSARGTRVYGLGALRYLLSAFDVRAPLRRLRGETEIPSAAELELAMRKTRTMTPIEADQALDDFFMRAFGSLFEGWVSLEH
jgi:hypothetical protein